MASILNATTSTGFTVTPDNSGSLQLATNNGTTAVTIDTSQNVGIGTTTNLGKLTAQGTITAKASADESILSISHNGSEAVISASYGSTGSYDPMVFKTSDAERMRLNSAGTLLIGATSSPSGTQRLVLTANGSAGIEPMLFNELRSTSATENYVRFYRNGSQVGSITNTLSATAYVTSSDYRLKENIAPMTGALAKVSQLKPCTYTWKSTGEASQGFIAHELQEIVPDCVTGEKDAVETYTDENGNEQTRIKPQGIDTSFLVATLTAAIQEQQAQIEELKAEVQALKGTL